MQLEVPVELILILNWQLKEVVYQKVEIQEGKLGAVVHKSELSRLEVYVN